MRLKDVRAKNEIVLFDQDRKRKAFLLPYNRLLPSGYFYSDEFEPSVKLYEYGSAAAHLQDVNYVYTCSLDMATVTVSDFTEGQRPEFQNAVELVKSRLRSVDPERFILSGALAHTYMRDILMNTFSSDVYAFYEYQSATSTSEKVFYLINPEKYLVVRN